MTSTVDDVIMLKKWRSNTDERDTLELLEEFVRFSRNKNDREFTSLNAAQYIVMYDELIDRLADARLISRMDANEKKQDIRNNIPDDAQKLLQAIEP